MKRYKGLGRVFSFTLTQQLRQRGWRTATIAVALACLLIPILSLTVAAQHQKNAAENQLDPHRKFGKFLPENGDHPHKNTGRDEHDQQLNQPALGNPQLVVNRDCDRNGVHLHRRRPHQDNPYFVQRHPHDQQIHQPQHQGHQRSNPKGEVSGQHHLSDRKRNHPLIFFPVVKFIVGKKIAHVGNTHDSQHQRWHLRLSDRTPCHHKNQIHNGDALEQPPDGKQVV